MDKKAIFNHFQGNFTTFYNKYLPQASKIGGQEYKTLCPFHQDTQPSFNFNAESGEYFCHACGKGGDPVHFYAKLNSLDTRRDFAKVLKGIVSDFGIPLNAQKTKVVRVYDYTNADGKLLFQVCRMEPKSFRQRVPDGNGRFKWGLNRVSPVLYRLPEVLKSSEVLIVEGEKDADTLHGLGLVATTNPMGAKKWLPQYSESLKGKDVVLIPDNDNEGREHMSQIGAAIKDFAKSIRWLDLPDLPSKGDVSDWLARFEDKTEAAERLSIMIENAELYEPPRKYTLEDAILTDQDFRALHFPQRECFVVPWLTEDGIDLISGWRGMGKTWLTLSILDAVTRGQPFGPWMPGISASCLFLDGEMPAQSINERLEALSQGREREHPLYIYSDHYANLLGLPKAHLANENWRKKMKSILQARHVKLWVIDNLASLAGGLDENLKKDWDPINQWLLELRFTGITTVMLHHTNKEGEQRGTSAREDNIDVSIVLKSPSDYTPEDGCRFVLHFTKSRVATRDLPLLADTEFKLIEDPTGAIFWSWGNVKRKAKQDVLTLIDEGLDTKAICDTLDITKGYVSRIRKWAIDEGYLTPKGKLTPAGYTFTNE